MIVSADSSTGVIAGSGAAQTPKQKSALAERTTCHLLQIVRSNLNTQYFAQAPSLLAFRDAISTHGGIKSDGTRLVADFRTHVPLSEYNCYKPFMDRFDTKPCRKEDVENLFAPGLPDSFLSSSSTSGAVPKLLPRYFNPRTTFSDHLFFDPNSKNPLAAVVYCGSLDLKEIEDASGQIVKKIPICLGSGQMVRGAFGWKLEDDETRLSITLSSYAVPWAATMIIHRPSFLTIHGLFFLMHRELDRFYAPYATLFVDLIDCIYNQWDTLVSCIKDGILPDLEGVDHVRRYLQAHLFADSQRAAELLKVGPPSSLEGWAPRIWPNLRELSTVCTGSWSTMLPKVRFILGPNILISSPGYPASESAIGAPYDVTKPEEFVLANDCVIEFLDISQPDAQENICQAWEVEVGKQYEPILTTNSGLWRYQLGDIVLVIGFHPESDSPIFRHFGRRSMKMHLPHAQVADFQLLEAVIVSNSEDTIIVQEFTTVVDDRIFPPTVGFFVELAKPCGVNAHLARQAIFDALATSDARHQPALEHGQIRLPTIRVLRPGTFSEYRYWMAEKLKISSGQLKVPIVLTKATVKEWILERVVQEL